MTTDEDFIADFRKTWELGDEQEKAVREYILLAREDEQQRCLREMGKLTKEQVQRIEQRVAQEIWDEVKEWGKGYCPGINPEVREIFKKRGAKTK